MWHLISKYLIGVMIAIQVMHLLPGTPPPTRLMILPYLMTEKKPGFQIIVTQWSCEKIVLRDADPIFRGSR
jgi:hypothetical protein